MGLSLNPPKHFLAVQMLLPQVLELRERRLDHEETLAEVQKATDEHKRNLDRQVRIP